MNIARERLKGACSEGEAQALYSELREEDLRTDFLDFCLNHMIDPEEYPGIQSLCMKLAYRMAQFYPELMEELLRTVKGMEME